MKSYVDFELVEQKPKTDVYRVFARSSLETLGRIYWYFGWRQYVFEPEGETVWSRGCLKEVMGFIGNLMTEWKNRRKVD